jgi:hypothetical protein
MINNQENPQGIGAQQEQAVNKEAIWTNVMDQLERNRSTLGSYFIEYGTPAGTPNEVDTRALIFNTALSDSAPSRKQSTSKYIALTREGPFRLLRPQFTPGGDGNRNNPDTMAARLYADTDLNTPIPNSGYQVTKGPHATEDYFVRRKSLTIYLVSSIRSS